MVNFMYIFEISLVEFIRNISVSKKHTLVCSYSLLVAKLDIDDQKTNRQNNPKGANDA